MQKMRKKTLAIIFFCCLYIMAGCSKNKEEGISQEEKIIKDNIIEDVIEIDKIEKKEEKEEEDIWKKQEGMFYNTVISFTYPKDWYFENFYGEDGSRVYFYEERGNEQPILSYEIGEAWRFDKNNTKDTYYRMLNESYNNIEILDFSKLSIEGNEAHKLIFTYEKDGSREAQIRYITSEGLLYHELCFFTSQDNMELKEKELDELVNTIHFIVQTSSDQEIFYDLDNDYRKERILTEDIQEKENYITRLSVYNRDGYKDTIEYNGRFSSRILLGDINLDGRADIMHLRTIKETNIEEVELSILSYDGKWIEYPDQVLNIEKLINVDIESGKNEELQLICLDATITEEGYLQLVLLENKEDNKIERQVTFSLKDNGWWIESVEIVSDDK